MVYVSESDWEMLTGLGVGSATTDIITSATFTYLEEKARMWTNLTLGRSPTSDISPVVYPLDEATGLRIKRLVLNSQAAADAAEGGGDILIQELQIKGKGDTSAKLRAHAKECNREAIQLLRRYGASPSRVSVHEARI